jgi:hypothetical protein
MSKKNTDGRTELGREEEEEEEEEDDFVRARSHPALKKRFSMPSIILSLEARSTSTL